MNSKTRDTALRANQTAQESSSFHMNNLFFYHFKFYQVLIYKDFIYFFFFFWIEFTSATAQFRSLVGYD